MSLFGPRRYFGLITKHPAYQRFACHVFFSEDSTAALAESVGWVEYKTPSFFLFNPPSWIALAIMPFNSLNEQTIRLFVAVLLNKCIEMHDAMQDYALIILFTHTNIISFWERIWKAIHLSFVAIKRSVPFEMSFGLQGRSTEPCLICSYVLSYSYISIPIY